MKKIVLFAGMMSLLLSSCTTIRVTTIPDGAVVRLSDGTSGVSPCTVRLGLFSSRKATISEKGFVDQSCDLSWSSSKEVEVVLNRELTILSRPEGASVTVNEKAVGLSPCTVQLPATVQVADIAIALDGYLPRNITFNCTKSTGEINVVLSKDGPGRRMPVLSFGRSGFPMFKEVFSLGEEISHAPSDRAELVTAFEKSRFPLFLRPFGTSNALLVTLVEPKNNRKHRNIILYKLDCADGSLAKVLSGHYFELNAHLSSQFLFYSSSQTGRFDLWKKDITSADAVPILLLTNSLIKTELDVSADGSQVLFTAFTPGEPNVQHIWLFVPGTTASAESYAISEGTHPAWAPNAQHFLFQKNAPERIAKADMDGSNIRILNDFVGNHRDMHPAWSPDGRLIAFASNRGNDSPDDFDIWVMDSNGEHPRKVTDSACRDDSPVFSPDGTAIYFRSNRNLAWGVWKIGLE